MPSHFATTTDVGDGVHKPAVQHAQARHREARVHAVPVAAVGVQQKRIVPCALHPLAVHNAHRHLHSVPRLDHHTLARVVVGIELASEDFLLLQGFDVARGKLVFQDAAWRGHRGVAVPQLLGVEVGVGSDIRRVGGVVERDVDIGRAVPALDADPVETFLPFLHHQVVVEDVNAFEQDVVAVRKHIFPVVVGRRVDGGLHQLEVLGAAVGDDVEVVAVVADAVFQIAFTLLHHLPLAVGRVGVEVPPLGAHRGAGANHEVLLGFGLANAARESLVLLLKHQNVLADRRAEHVLVDLEGAQGHGVLLGVEERFVVVGPGGASCGFRDAVFEELSGPEVLHKQGVLTAAHRVDAVHQEVVVRAHADPAHREVAVALGQGRLVQHDLLLGLHRALFAAGEGVLFAFFVAAVVPVSLVQHRHALVVLFDAPDNLIVELGLKGFGGGHDLLFVAVFRFEVGHHFRRLGIGLLGFLLGVAEAHPEVVIVQLETVNVRGVWLLGRIGRRGELRSLGHVIGSLHVLRGGRVAA